MGVPDTRVLNVSQPKFLQAVSAQLAKRPLADWKRYLRWHLANTQARYLSRAFADEDFAFRGKVLFGTEEQAPRWKRCVRWVDRDLGEALGQVFVQKNFSPELKQKTLEMVQHIEKEMEADLRTLDWMSQPTRSPCAGEARGDGQQDRLSRQVAGLHVDQDRLRRLPGERRPVDALRDRPATGANRQAGRTAASGR